MSQELLENTFSNISASSNEKKRTRHRNIFEMFMQISSSTILEGLVGNFIHALLKIMGEFGPILRQCEIMHDILFCLEHMHAVSPFYFSNPIPMSCQHQP